MGSQSRDWYRTQTKRFIQILWLWNFRCQRSFIQVNSNIISGQNSNDKFLLDARKPWKTSKNEIANWKWLESKIKISFNANSASKWVKILSDLLLNNLSLGNCGKIRKIISAWERRIEKIFKYSFRSVPKEFGRIRRTSGETFAK